MLWEYLIEHVPVAQHPHQRQFWGWFHNWVKFFYVRKTTPCQFKARLMSFGKNLAFKWQCLPQCLPQSRWSPTSSSDGSCNGFLIVWVASPAINGDYWILHQLTGNSWQRKKTPVCWKFIPLVCSLDDGGLSVVVWDRLWDKVLVIITSQSTWARRWWLEVQCTSWWDFEHCNTGGRISSFEVSRKTRSSPLDSFGFASCTVSDRIPSCRGIL